MASKVQSLIKLTLVFFVSLLSFSVGTYVGFKFSENKHKLAILEPETQKKRQSVAGASGHHDEFQADKLPPASRNVASALDSDELLKNEMMSDEEIAQLAEEFVKDSSDLEHAASDHKEAPANKSPSKSPASAAPASHAATHAPTPSEKSPTPTTATVPAPKARIPQSLPPAAGLQSPGKFTVQVSSFAGETEAKERAQELRTQGYNAFYVPAKIKGSTWYRVSIGLFQSENEAKTLQETYLKSNASGKAFIARIPTE